MLTQYRHLSIGEGFSHEDRLYIKANHQRGRRSDVTGRPQYRYFKPNSVVRSKYLVTKETEYMEVKEAQPCCRNPHTIPFDNDKQCTNCGKCQCHRS